MLRSVGDGNVLLFTSLLVLDISRIPSPNRLKLIQQDGMDGYICSQLLLEHAGIGIFVTIYSKPQICVSLTH